MPRSRIPRPDDPFSRRMFKIYDDALRDLGYQAGRFYNKILRGGGQAAARYYLRPSKGVTPGFRELLEHDRLDLSVEAVVIEEPEWQQYLSPEEVEAARRRLAVYGYFARRAASNTSSDQLSPDELPEAATYPEGLRTEITVNAYERNPEARAKCIAYYGTKCFVCRFDFAATYGEDLGKGCIHVHHLTPFAGVGGPRQTDPIEDLRPVCPNCHWMLHRRNPPIPVAVLKRIVKRKRS